MNGLMIQRGQLQGSQYGTHYFLIPFTNKPYFFSHVDADSSGSATHRISGYNIDNQTFTYSTFNGGFDWQAEGY